MKLVSFSLQKYRSIQRAEKITLGNLTVLVGPNNEGKSNILHGLIVGTEMLTMTVPKSASQREIDRYVAIRRRRDLYEWERDFPIALQSKQPNGQSIFDFEFELSADEVDEFRKSVKSNLNGSLPIRLSLGRDSSNFEVKKRGPGAATLTKKRPAIARFVAEHVHLRDIPSVRTASSAMQLIDEMVARELRQLEGSDDYREAVERISRLQQPILETLSGTVKSMLSTFLPDVTDVAIEVTDRYSALRRNSKIVVDDGTATDLRYKGDGVQSLAAISLIHHISQQAAGESELLLAIEEPEAHLHPKAIHRLRAVLQDIARRQQVVVTTHSPLLVNRADIESNVIVDRNRARRARTVQEVRESLGVRVSDSLASAELVLIVEGESDRRALLSLLPQLSSKLSTALSNNVLAVDSLQGATNLSYKLSQLRDQLCITHAFLDHDLAAQTAVAKADNQGLSDPVDRTFATSPGMKESELEDLYDFALYRDIILKRYNIDLTASKTFKLRKRKWTDRVEAAFLAGGQTWDDSVCKQVKTQVADLVEANPIIALHVAWKSPMEGLVLALEAKLESI